MDTRRKRFRAALLTHTWPYSKDTHSHTFHTILNRSPMLPRVVIVAPTAPPLPPLRTNLKYRQNLNKTLAAMCSHSTTTCIPNLLQKVSLPGTDVYSPLDIHRVCLWNFFSYYSLAVSSSQMVCFLCLLLSKDTSSGLTLSQKSISSHLQGLLVLGDRFQSR